MIDPDTKKPFEVETDLNENKKLRSVIRDMQQPRIAPLEKPQCPFCFRYDGKHNSRCTAEGPPVAAARVRKPSASAYRSPGRRNDRIIDDIQKQAQDLALEHAFEKSEQMYPMHGDMPEEVQEDRLFRAIYHMWKRDGSRKDDPRIQRMRERWMVLTTGIEVVKGAVN